MLWLLENVFWFTNILSEKLYNWLDLHGSDFDADRLPSPSTPTRSPSSLPKKKKNDLNSSWGTLTSYKTKLHIKHFLNFFLSQK